MNKNFDKDAQKKRLLEISNKPSIAIESSKLKFVQLDRVGQLKQDYEHGWQTYASLERFLKSVKKADFNADLIFMFAFFKIIELQRKNEPNYDRKRKTPHPRQFPDFSPVAGEVVKTINKYGVGDIITISYFFDFELSPKSINFWLNVFSKMPDYNEHFAPNGKYYREAVTIISNYTLLSEKLNLQDALGSIPLSNPNGQSKKMKI